MVSSDNIGYYVTDSCDNVAFIFTAERIKVNISVDRFNDFSVIRLFGGVFVRGRRMIEVSLIKVTIIIVSIITFRFSAVKNFGIAVYRNLIFRCTDFR